MAEILNFDPNSLTLGEIDDLETALDTTIGALGAKWAKGAENLSAKDFIGLVWIMKRRQDPEFTLADARNTPISNLSELTGGPLGSGDA